MYLIIDDRPDVWRGYLIEFEREGIAFTGLNEVEFRSWFESSPDVDLASVEGFLVGTCEGAAALPTMIKSRSHAPIIGIVETSSLSNVLDVFASGADDVVRKPVHIREILARADAIRRRSEFGMGAGKSEAALEIFHDGRDPQISGETIALPRRERRILEFLDSNRERRVTKAQILSAVYGLFDADVPECVVESHISKLRRKLSTRLGYDPIDSKRYLGYQLTHHHNDRVGWKGGTPASGKADRDLYKVP